MGRDVAFSGLPRTMSCLARRIVRLGRVMSTLRPASSTGGRVLIRVSRTTVVVVGSGPAVCQLIGRNVLPSCGGNGGLCFCGSRLLT